jgi:hypothetical protein
MATQEIQAVLVEIVPVERARTATSVFGNSQVGQKPSPPIQSGERRASMGIAENSGLRFPSDPFRD